MSVANDTIYRDKFKSKRYTLQRYWRSSSDKVVIYIQKLHNRLFPDDGPKSGRRYLGNKKLWKIHQPIPA